MWAGARPPGGHLSLVERRRHEERLLKAFMQGGRKKRARRRAVEEPRAPRHAVQLLELGAVANCGRSIEDSAVDVKNSSSIDRHTAARRAFRARDPNRTPGGSAYARG